MTRRSPYGPASRKSIGVSWKREKAVGELFFTGETSDRRGNVVHLKTGIPVRISALNLDNGLRPGLTNCNEVTEQDVASVPFQALWHGLSHPGLDWSDAVTERSWGLTPLMVD
jgi:pyruvate,water dikinase